MTKPLVVTFVGGDHGSWRVERLAAVTGPGLPAVRSVEMIEGSPITPPVQPAQWILRGVTSNQRYVERVEQAALAASQAQLGRPEATMAALIPIRKSPAWWALPQDERRAIFEARSRHIAVGLEYLPAVARRLHHGRDLGEEFDFLTWFEYSPADAGLFEELVARLRASDEWSYVEREVDLRLSC